MDVLYTVYIKKPNIVFFQCGIICLWSDLFAWVGAGFYSKKVEMTYNLEWGSTTGYVFCLQERSDLVIMIKKKERTELARDDGRCSVHFYHLCSSILFMKQRNIQVILSSNFVFSSYH